MSTLVIAEHDNDSLKGATLNAVTAAQALGGDIDIALQVLTTHHIENHINATFVGVRLNHLDKVLLAVINGSLHPQRFAGLTLFSISGSGIYGCAHGNRHLNGRGTNTSGTTMYQQGFSGC